MKKSIGKLITLVYIFSLFSSPVFADEIGGHDVDIQENPETGGFTVCVDEACTNLDDENPELQEPLLKMGIEIALIAIIVIIIQNQINNEVENSFKKIGEELNKRNSNPPEPPPSTNPPVDPPMNPPVNPPTPPSSPGFPQVA
jgi:hypothetical protein